MTCLQATKVVTLMLQLSQVCVRTSLHIIRTNVHNVLWPLCPPMKMKNVISSVLHALDSNAAGTATVSEHATMDLNRAAGKETL